MAEAYRSDPFSPACDPRAYVPRPDADAALRQLEQGVRCERDLLLLVGAPGVGKTLLLHVLASRLCADFRTAYVPHPLLSPRELWLWVLYALDERAGADPEGALRGLTASWLDGERRILLLVDSAESLPPETARSLGALVAASDGVVRAVLAVGSEPRAQALAAALARPARLLRLKERLGPDETAAYLRARLARLGAEGAFARRFPAEVIAHLHREAEGNPARLNALADAVLRGMASASRAEARPAARRAAIGAAAPPQRGVPPGRRPLPTPAWPARRWPRRAAAALAASAALLAAALLLETPASREPAAPAPPAVRVNVNAFPWAEISVDGTAVGETPLADLPLLPGAHRFAAALPDGRVIERVVEISPRNRHVVFP